MAEWNVDIGTLGGSESLPGGESPGDASTPELDYDAIDGCWDGIIANDTSPNSEDLFLLGDEGDIGASLSKIDESVPEPWEKLGEIAAGKSSSLDVKMETSDGDRSVPFLVFSEPDEAAGQKRKAPETAVKAESGSDDGGNIEDPAMAALASRDPATLSAEELKLLKKQKRLVRNRQSAQLSRQRKKSHMETLEIQVQELERERRALIARVDLLSRENQYLRKQLGAQGRRLPPPPPMPVAPRMARAPILMAVLFAAGVLFTQTDLMARPEPDFLPQLYVGGAQGGNGVEVMAGSALVQGSARRGGRVLLSVDDEFGQSFGEDAGSGVGELSQQEVLIMTLLDHVTAAHSSPTLLPRLCARLHDMGVMSSCQGQPHALEEIRQRFLAEFLPFRSEFFSSADPDHSSSSSSFSSSADHHHPDISSELSPRYTQHQIASALPRPPLFPLAPLDKRRQPVAAVGLHSDLNLLCPSAQLLIADRPANAPPVPAVPSVNNVTTDAAGWRHEPLEEDDEDDKAEEGRGGWRPTVVSDGATVSMMLPRETLEGVSLAGARLAMPEGGSRMVEFRCSAFDLHPFTAAPSLLAA